MGGGQDDEIDRLAHRHEIAHHVGMRDGDRPATFNLRLELGHDRADRAQHIAEPHGNKAQAASAPARSPSTSWAYIIRKTLRRAEHGNGIDGLVGRDQHARRADAAVASTTLTEPKILVLTPSVQSEFELRHLFQRRRVGKRRRGGTDRTKTSAADDRECRRHRARSRVAAFVASNCSLIANRAGSELSIMSNSAAPRATTRAQISEPIEPPPPVTTTRLSLTKAASPLRSASTLGRNSRSSISTASAPSAAIFDRLQARQRDAKALGGRHDASESAPEVNFARRENDARDRGALLGRLR